MLASSRSPSGDATRLDPAHEPPAAVLARQRDGPDRRRAGDEAAGRRARREPVDDLRERAAAGDEHALEVEHPDSLGGLRAARDPRRERAPPLARRAPPGPAPSRPPTRSARPPRSTSRPCRSGGSARGCRGGCRRAPPSAPRGCRRRRTARARTAPRRSPGRASRRDRAEPGQRAALAQERHRVRLTGEDRPELRPGPAPWLAGGVAIAPPSSASSSLPFANTIPAAIAATTSISRTMARR